MVQSIKLRLSGMLDSPHFAAAYTGTYNIGGQDPPNASGVDNDTGVV